MTTFGQNAESNSENGKKKKMRTDLCPKWCHLHLSTSSTIATESRQARHEYFLVCNMNDNDQIYLMNVQEKYIYFHKNVVYMLLLFSFSRQQLMPQTEHELFASIHLAAFSAAYIRYREQIQ